MCLNLIPHEFSMFYAKESIKVFKVLEKGYSRTGEEILHSPYYKTKYIPFAQYKSVITIAPDYGADSIFRTSSALHVINEGLHSYANPQIAGEIMSDIDSTLHKRVLYEAVIPKGALVICSRSGEVCSSALIVYPNEKTFNGLTITEYFKEEKKKLKLRSWRQKVIVLINRAINSMRE